MPVVVISQLHLGDGVRTKGMKFNEDELKNKQSQVTQNLKGT